MADQLNLHDIQGNVTRAYGRFSFPFARYLFFRIRNPAAGRAFVDAVRKQVTTSARWPEEADKPECTVNIAFTFMGLYWLEVPDRTLQGMPDVFISGMRSRSPLSSIAKEFGGPISSLERNPKKASAPFT